MRLSLPAGVKITQVAAGGWARALTVKPRAEDSKRRTRGEGTIAFGGQLLDKAIVDLAQQTLALADSLGA